MALSDCPNCWMTPCECGHEYKNINAQQKEKLTKAINGFTIEDVFIWLANKDYLSDNYYNILREFKESQKNKTS